MKRPTSFVPLIGLLFVFLLLPASDRAGAETLQQIFGRHDPASSAAVDHSKWDALLKAHIVPGEDGLNRVDYAGFKEKGASALKRYIAGLQQTDIATLNRDEQFAFWANLYNAKTIDIILDHYPVVSIRDIRLSGLFSTGPWDKKVVTVRGTPLSLNDIEHEILRRVWRDPRVHYAVNCASIGCPNLPRQVFTGALLEAALENGAREYINSTRGIRATGGKVVVSKIYSWFAEDFGGSVDGVLAHIRQYARPDLAARIEKVTSIAGYAYDWRLNDAK